MDKPKIINLLPHAVISFDKQSLAFDFLASKFEFQPPFFLGSCIIDKTTYEIILEIQYPPKTLFPCPICQKLVKVHSVRPRKWQDLDDANYHVFLKMDVPIVKCHNCGMHAIEIPWARSRSNFTNRLEWRILSDVQKLSLSEIAKRYSITYDRIFQIIVHYVGMAKAEDNMSGITVLVIDETSYATHHKYITILYSTIQDRVLCIAEGKGIDAVISVGKMFENFGGNTLLVKDVALDMSRPFISGVTKIFPNAHLTFDKFHIIALCNKSVNNTRILETKDEPKLVGTKNIWLKNRENWTNKQSMQFNSLSKMRLKTLRAFLYKEELINIYNLNIDSHKANNLLTKYISKGLKSRNPNTIEFAKTMKAHLSGIVRHFDSKLTSAVIESNNRIVQDFIRRGRGFKNLQNLMNMIYLRQGGLKIPVLPSNGNPIIHEALKIIDIQP
jgi:transposase